jgi:outer membrane protein TolC
LPINLPTALKLANAQAVDVVAAAERERIAAAVLYQARVEWLPTVTLGGDYNRHDGAIQNADGTVIDASHSSWMYGAGTGIGQAAILDVNNAIFDPLAARQTVRARQADLQAARNDTLVAVTDAYFNVQQARGDLAGAEAAERYAEQVLSQTTALAKDLTAPVDVVRARTEVSHQRQLVEAARERWRTAGAELNRVLRVDPGALVVPVEPPHLKITVVPRDRSLDDLIALGLTFRPELASQQALVQASLVQLRQERLRPLIPSILVRGNSTAVTGTLAVGQFGGGPNGSLGTTGARGDFDVQVLWQLDNLGLGNVGHVRQRQAENRLAVEELFRVQDRVAADVAQAYARVQSAAARAEEAETEVKDAAESAGKNLEGLRQPKNVGGVAFPLVPPLAAVAAVQALDQAYADYYGAVADYDRAQFQLYRALGRPAQALADDGAACAPPAAGRP